MHISGSVLFMWDVVSSFQKLSHKKPDFGTPKWKIHFSWEETENGLYGVPRHPRATHVFDMGLYKYFILFLIF
jgi:hypothetical protein